MFLVTSQACIVIFLSSSSNCSCLKAEKYFMFILYILYTESEIGINSSPCPVPLLLPLPPSLFCVVYVVVLWLFHDPSMRRVDVLGDFVVFFRQVPDTLAAQARCSASRFAPLSIFHLYFLRSIPWFTLSDANKIVSIL